MANIDDEIPAGLTDKQVETLKQVSITEEHCQKGVEIMCLITTCFGSSI